MKKTYESPVAEKIEFRYADQIVASAGKVEYPGECDYISGGLAKPTEAPPLVPSRPD